MPLAMRPLCDQMAHCRRTVRLPNAIDTPCNNRYTFGAALRDLTGAPAGKISDFSRGARGAALKRASPCERLVSGSTPNEITSCLRTSRSEFSLIRLRKRDGVLNDARSNTRSPAANYRRQRITAIFGCRTRKHPSFGEARTMSYVTSRKRGADKVVRHRRGKRHPIQGHTQLTSIFG